MTRTHQITQYFFTRNVHIKYVSEYWHYFCV